MAFEIYQIRHRESGKVYVGCTTLGLTERWKKHVYAASCKKPPYVVHKAIAKYGADAFDVSLLSTAASVEEMLALEKRWIADSGSVYPCGYNMTAGGDGIFGAIPAVIEKIRAANLGRKHSPERCARNAAAQTGRKHSEATKAKMRLAKRSEAHKAALSRANKGKAMSEATKAKISAAKRGIPTGRLGIPLSEETKAKLRGPRGPRKSHI